MSHERTEAQLVFSRGDERADRECCLFIAQRALLTWLNQNRKPPIISIAAQVTEVLRRYEGALYSSSIKARLLIGFAGIESSANRLHHCSTAAGIEERDQRRSLPSQVNPELVLDRGQHRIDKPWPIQPR